MNRWRILLWPALATGVALGILLSLGTWQLLRLYDKKAILFGLEASISAVPKPLTSDGPDLAAIEVWPVATRDIISPGFRELTRVSTQGTYIPARSIPVRVTMPAPKNARSIGGLGFFWMTPLQTENGTVVFINRGFVPAGPDSKPPAIETPEGLQTITGLIRLPEKPQTFTPSDNPARGEYFVRDPKTMAAAVSIRQVALGFFIDAERTSNDAMTPPVGIDARDMIARISNNHLQYAVTWYGFAVTLLIIFGLFARTRLREHKTKAILSSTKKI
jgi:surfeit locus 1 family protein